jgi:heme A synthase
MLIALAAIIEYPALSFWQLTSMVWLVIFFVWTSMFAMGIRAVSGERGLRLTGSIANKVVYILYALGTITIFPACALLIYGLIKAI